MNFWHSLKGVIHLELTGADIVRSLKSLNSLGITLESVAYRDDLTATFCVSREQYPKLEHWASHRGDTLKILKREGLYWNLIQLRRRPVLVWGLTVLLCLAIFLPTRVCFIQVEGNQRIPSRKILEAAGESGISFGASRRQVRSEKVKNQLLAAVPELQWAGVNTYGCVAVISVRERSIPEPTKDQQIRSIVSARDGIILTCTATRGNLLCAPGQAVQKGDILISAFTDCGLTVTATRAEGEILALTQRNLTAVTPSRHQKIGAAESESTKYSLIIGKKRINFYKGSGIWGATCGKMYKQYYLTLPGGFRLPVALVKEVLISYELTDAPIPESDAQTQLADFAENYLRSIMIAGTTTNEDVSFERQDSLYCLAGKFSCTEMIGSVRYEKIGEYHGKTDGTNRQRGSGG